MSEKNSFEIAVKALGKDNFDEAEIKAIRRCNATDELYKACKATLKILERFGQHEIDCATQASEVAGEFKAMGCTCGVQKARDALAKIKH